IIDAILGGYAEELRVPELAAMVGLSPRQLERRFLKELGRTPKRFILEVRIGAAEHLLQNTDLAIAQIAMDVGFQTPSHFTDTFKALTGRTPNAARSQQAEAGTFAETIAPPLDPRREII
ncbi:MAG TPA: AraC family transcriptional regulator, partial [Stenomitos sp.]